MYHLVSIQIVRKSLNQLVTPDMSLAWPTQHNNNYRTTNKQYGSLQQRKLRTFYNVMINICAWERISAKKTMYVSLSTGTGSIWENPSNYSAD